MKIPPGIFGHRLLLTASMLTRLGFGLIQLVGLARYLPPTGLGIISVALALGAFLSVVTDWGMTGTLLRRIGIAPRAAWLITERALMIKLIGSAILFLPTAALILFLPVWSGYREASALILIASFVTGFAELLLAALRARRAYLHEFVVTVPSSFAYAALPIATAALTGDLWIVSMAILATRLLYLGGAIIASWHVAQPLRWRRAHWRGLIFTARSSGGFAGESIFTSLTNFSDTFLLSVLLTPAALGIYQAGGRLLQAISPIAAMLAISHLPKAAAAYWHRIENFRREECIIWIEFWLCAIGTALFFLCIGPVITRHIYGPGFAKLDLLWGGFAATGMLRFIAGAFGLLVMAGKGEALLSLSRIGYLLTMLGGCWLFVPGNGLAAVPAVTSAASAVLLLCNGYAYGRTFSFGIGTVAMAAAAILLAAGMVLGLPL